MPELATALTATNTSAASSFSSPAPPPTLSTLLPDAHVAPVHRPDGCLQTGTYVNIILDHYNFTGKLSNRHSQEDKMDILKLITAGVCCLIILENLLVLLAIMWKLRSRRWVFFCIASITLSDLLAGVAYLLNLCLSGSRTFRLSPTMWFLREGVLFIALAASIFSLLVTAIERHSAMVRSIAENGASKSIRLKCLIVFSWGLAILIGLLPLLGWNCLCNKRKCSTLLPLYDKNYLLFSVIMFSIILVCVVSLYASIYHCIRKSTKHSISRYGHKRSLRLLKVVMMILGTFLFCWIPLFILLLLDISWTTRTPAFYKAFSWALTLAVLNSFINPIIYSFGSQEMKRAVLELICCCCIKAGLHGPRDCFVFSDVPSLSSTESSLRIRESFRNSMMQNRRVREPLSSNSSMLSTDISVLHRPQG